MQLLIKLTRVIDRISNAAGALTVFLVIITIAVGFYNVVVRYMGRFIGIQLSTNLYLELQWHLYALTFLLGFAYILQHGINVRVDFIYTHWPKKRKAMLDFWGHIFFLIPFCILAIYVTINPVMTSWGRLPSGEWGTWELSPDPDGIPRAPIKTMIIVGFTLLFLQTFSELFKLWMILRGQEAQLGVDIEDSDAPLRIE